MVSSELPSSRLFDQMASCAVRRGQAIEAPGRGKHGPDRAAACSARHRLVAIHTLRAAHGWAVAGDNAERLVIDRLGSRPGSLNGSADDDVQFAGLGAGIRLPVKSSDGD